MNSGDENIPSDASRIAYLIAGFLRNDLTETEHDELDAWIEAHPDNMRLFGELTDDENLQAAQIWFQKYGHSRPANQRYKKIQKRIRMHAVPPVWYLAAACLLALAGISIYLLATSKNSN